MMTRGDTIYVSLIFVAFFIKFYVLYSQLHLGGYELCFALSSLGIVFLLFSLVSLLSHKAARVFLTVLYFTVSIILGVDGVYYAYASKLPSAALLSMVWQIDGVSDAVDSLIKIKHILNIIDLPLWTAWLIDRDLLRRKTPHFTEWLSKPFANRFIVSAALVVLTGLFAVYNFAVRDFIPSYLENELFVYHVNDIHESFFAKPEERLVDKTQYISPDWSDSEYYGIAEGRNVFVIQVEAMQNFVIGASYEGQELMPNLNALIGNDSFYFDNYYYQIGGGNTSDAEFTVNNSLFAPESEAAYVKYPDNDYYGLPKILKDNGYTGAYAFHGYEGIYWNREYAYVGQGFDDYTSMEDLDTTLNPEEADSPFLMGISDHEFFRQSIDVIKTYEEPFYSFMITLSSHYPYALPTKARHIELKPEDESTLFGLYIQSMNYFDRSIGEFIEMLKEADLYDNSIIVIYGDHYALSSTDAGIASRFKEMLGRSYTIYDLFNIPLIIHIPGMKNAETLGVTGGHIDVLPTLLCLLGINNDKSVMFGQNLLEAENGFVCEQTHVARGSFISDDVFFKKPHNNIKTNYDVYERGTMNRLDPDDFMDLSEYSFNRIADCEALLENNDILIKKDEQ